MAFIIRNLGFQSTIDPTPCFKQFKKKKKDNKIQTTVYSKPTDSQLYFQADSCHHLPSILGIEKDPEKRS